MVRVISEIQALHLRGRAMVVANVEFIKEERWIWDRGAMVLVVVRGSTERTRVHCGARRN